MVGGGTCEKRRQLWCFYVKKKHHKAGSLSKWSDHAKKSGESQIVLSLPQRVKIMILAVNKWLSRNCVVKILEL
jgi:hypothetical protein